MAKSPTAHHQFDNGPLLTASGEIDMVYLRKTARLRAISLDPTCVVDLSEIKIWEDRLYGMADAMRAGFARNAEMRRRLAVSALIGQCEAIASSGALTAPARQSLRFLIDQTTSAFDMPAKAMRVSEDA
jgi:hypothetical protein